MSDKKIIAIIGATGAQGGGLARAILHDKNSDFAVRAITRVTTSDKAQALASLGAELLQADLDDIDSLKKAFQGAYGAFCITNFWEHFSPEKEIKQAKNMAMAAREAGVKHAIWSSLEDTRNFVPLDDDSMPTLMGNYKVPHFDAKGEADKFFLNDGPPTTILHTAFYWDNMIYFGLGPKRGEDGKLAIAFPMGDKKLPAIAVEDIGKAAYGIFKAGKEYIGKTIGISSEHLSGKEMAEGLSGIVGEDVFYYDVPAGEYRNWGFPGAEDLGNMFQFKRDFNESYTRSRDIELTRKLNPELMDYKTWLETYGSKIPLE